MHWDLGGNTDPKGRYFFLERSALDLCTGCCFTSLASHTESVTKLLFIVPRPVYLRRLGTNTAGGEFYTPVVSRKIVTLKITRKSTEPRDKTTQT